MKLNKPVALNEIGGRTNNEDSIFPQKGKATENDRYFLVCDGMGGHANGEVASGSVCESFGEYLKTTGADIFDAGVFNQALSYAYDRLDEKDTSPAGGKKMGTTLTFLGLNNRGAWMAHIGDSRIYHLRKTDKGVDIRYKSADHSLVNDLVRAQVITPEEAKTHPKRNVITRAMQPHLEQRYPAEITETADVQAGDYFFLCSDGVLEQLNDSKLIDIIAADTSAEKKIQAVYSLCEGKSKDNFSAYLIEITEGTVKTPETVTATIPETNRDCRMPQPPAEPLIATEIQVEPDNRKIRRLLYVIILLLAILIGIAVWFFVFRQSDGKVNESAQECPEAGVTKKSSAETQTNSQPVTGKGALDEHVAPPDSSQSTTKPETPTVSPDTGGRPLIFGKITEAVIIYEAETKALEDNKEKEDSTNIKTDEPLNNEE
jgi:serine/threonine protein phosphatase PrpC